MKKSDDILIKLFAISAILAFVSAVVALNLVNKWILIGMVPYFIMIIVMSVYGFIVGGY